MKVHTLGKKIKKLKFQRSNVIKILLRAIMVIKEKKKMKLVNFCKKTTRVEAGVIKKKLKIFLN